jgi:lactate permease
MLAAVAPLLAAAPLVAVVTAMVLLGLPAALAGTIGLALAFGLLPLGFDLSAGGTLPVGLAVGGPLVEAVSAAAVILWIILPALTLYELQSRAGALERIRAALAALTPNRSLQVLLIAWFFGLFLEGAAGFGTPVALAAPLLVGLGLPPVRAVAVALLGHAPGVSFGAIGTPVFAQLDATGLTPGTLALATAALHAPLLPVVVLVVLRLAKGASLDRNEVAWGLVAAICFALPFLALAMLAGPELATLGGALIGGGAFALLLRRQGQAPFTAPGLLRDLAPYLLIVLLVLATRLIGPLHSLLIGVQLAWEMPGGFRGGLQPLYHPGTLLAIGVVAGAAMTGRAGLLVPAVLAALRRLAPVAVALAVMLSLARVMVHAGMIDALAEAATGAGRYWPLLAPLIGVLGTFVTGSATASNILFTPFQAQTATALALPAAQMAAAQGLGAAIGNAVAPHNIIAGAATVGLSGREGPVMRLTAIPVLAYALGAGAILLLWTG